MEHYVTLFDRLFLPQGLALYESMERHCKNYILWILCVDDESYNVLSRLHLANIKLLPLRNLETQELLAVKSDRSRGEYCWTLTPFAPQFVFDADPEVDRVTYLDADMWFRKSPQLIHHEFTMSGKGVMITDHAYAPEYDSSATSGQYCVQFMTFHRIYGKLVLQWWQEKCIEWCYARYEDGKFGDQKYLDCWPELFPDQVHILSQKDLLLAPWNITRFPYGQSVAYHFQGLRIAPKGKVLLAPTYSLPSLVIENIYRPYLNDLKCAISRLESFGNWKVIPQGHPPNWLTTIRPLIAFFFRNAWRVRRNRIMKL
jgi:hypothetical protein